MSAYATTTAQSPAHPYAIYSGPKTGNEFGMSDIRSTISSALRTAAGEAVQKVEFKSQVTPPVTIDRPFAGTAEQPSLPAITGGTPLSDRILGFVKPAVYFHTPAGIFPVEPWGRPERDWSGWILAGSGLALGAALFVGIKIGKRAICPR